MKKQMIIFAALLMMGAATAFGQVGIGTPSPEGSAILELNSNNKGLLPPRVTLTSNTDAVTIPSPATGLTVYHLGSASMEAGLYSNSGTPASPKWNTGSETISNSEGSKVYKSKYRGRNVTPYTKPELIVPELNVMFRFADAGGMKLQVRLIDPPASTVNIRLVGHWQGQAVGGYNNTATFTSATYSAWQNFGGDWSGEWGYYYLVYSDEVRSSGLNPFNYSMNLYGICSYGFYGSGNAAKEIYSLAAEVF